MGTVFLLLVIPVALWLVGECLARFSRAPSVWALFGFNLARDDDASGDEPRRRPIGREPDLAPRLALHEMKPRRIVLDSEDRSGAENGRLEG